MTNAVVEVRRRLAWESRLARSSLRLEADSGARNALWVFDSRRGPDGYALRGQMLELAQREGLKLFSFGPRRGRRMQAATGWSHALRRSPGLRARIAHRIEDAARECGAGLFVVGSARGTFAAAIKADVVLWEVQHGLLDASYFPVRANRFFTRSATSHSVLESMAPDACLEVLGEDLAPPRTRSGDPADARSIVCFSKNPGGGCTADALAQFEQAAVQLAKRLDLPFELKLHPRDNLWKLLARHRCIGIRRYLYPANPIRGDAKRLVLSSFSTALTTETGPGDLLLNVALSAPDEIVAAEYAWLPTVAVADLASMPNPPVAERT